MESLSRKAVESLGEPALDLSIAGTEAVIWELHKMSAYHAAQAEMAEGEIARLTDDLVMLKDVKMGRIRSDGTR